MLTHDSPTRFRRAALVCTGAVSLVLAGGLTGAAFADTPQGWEQSPRVSVLGFLLVALIIPVGAAAVITLLAVLPSMAKDKGYEAGQSWRGQPEWFGGPTKGVAAADSVTPEQLESGRGSTGSVSGSW